MEDPPQHIRPIAAKPQEKDWPDDSEAILELGDPKLPENIWMLKDAFEGTQVFGSTGSGKSSATGKQLALAFLESNMGGLVLTVKPDERQQWEDYAERTGRSRDLIIFGAGQKWRFDFLRYELERGISPATTENLVNLFCTVVEAADRKSGSGGDGYWMRALRQLLRNAIDLCLMALGKVDLSGIYSVITTAPINAEQSKDDEWKGASDCYYLIRTAESKVTDEGRKRDLKLTKTYWLNEYANLAVETRSAIVSMFTSMADGLLRGLPRELLSGDVNFRPEDCFDGKVIILDLPIKEYYEIGQFIQVLFKYIWQRAVERRIPTRLGREKAQATIRPVFLYVDESQFYINQYEALFQSTARSARACTVYLTQNLPGYQAFIGGSDSRAMTDSIIGNLQTKIWHANGDAQTNLAAADTIGRTRQIQLSGGLTETAAGAKGGSQNAGGTMTFEYLVQPQEFTLLRTGGDINELMVDAIIFQSGRGWVAEEKGRKVVRNYIRHAFDQRA